MIRYTKASVTLRKFNLMSRKVVFVHMIALQATGDCSKILYSKSEQN